MEINIEINGIKYYPKTEIELMPMSFGEFLRQCRKNLGLTLDEAANVIICSKSYIWELENGTIEPSFKMAIKISNAFGIELITLASYLKNDYFINERK